MGTLFFVCALVILVCVSCVPLPLPQEVDFGQYEEVKGNHDIKLRTVEEYTMGKRAHRACPLYEAGLGVGMFSQVPSSLVEGNIGELCTTAGIGEGNTCCQSSYFDLINTPFADPFGSSALDLLGESPSAPCSSALSKFTCGVCSEHQDAFIQNHDSYSEVRLCMSYCQSLLEACDTVSGTDAFHFCTDMFANVDNVQISVTVDVGPDWSAQDSMRSCYSDAKECTRDDFVPFYTECGHNEEFRSVHYNFKDDECRGGEPLPDPIEGLPCHHCDSGSYPVAETECAPCEPGTHRNSGYYNDQWKEWPADFNFKTYCEVNNGHDFVKGALLEDDPNCVGWVLKDSHIESGDTIGDSQQSILELSIYLVADGHVGFDYKVMSETSYDGLYFLIDDLITMKLKSRVTEWERYEVGMTAGSHVLKWMYFKDYSYGLDWDMAMIDKIFVVGTNWAGTGCEQCSPGHYSDSGADMCTKCPLNTYSDTFGAAECKPCPDDKYAVVGSLECEAKPPCTDTDVVTVYSACSEGSRIRVSYFSEPILCDTTDYDLPEDAEGVPCADCNPGMYRPKGGSLCTFCEDGTYSGLVGATECIDCPAGTIPQKAILYTRFDHWDELVGMSTDCQGDCSNNGWRLLGDDIDSNVGHGAVLDSNLYFDFVPLETYGRVQWNFTISCSHICRFQIIDVGVTDGTRTHYVTTESNIGPYVENLNLSPGSHRVQWVFSKIDDSVLNSPGDRLTIHGFTVFGAEGGGAIGCQDCQGSCQNQTMG